MTDAAMILTTRPWQDAERDINHLEQHGHAAISAPMLVIRPLNAKLPSPETIDAVVLTSRHAAPLLGAPFHHLPCYCVGSTTAEAARAAGFSTIITGPGDGTGLAEVIRQQAPGRLIWASARDTGFNIAAALANDGITTERVAVYEAALAEDFPPEALAAIKAGRIGVVLAHSGRAGEHFTRLVQRHGLGDQLAAMTMIAISPRAAGLCGADWHTIRIVDQPRRSAMLAAAMAAAGPLDPR